MVFRSSRNADETNRYLSQLSAALQNANGLNLTHLNIFAETLFCRLLNKLYQADLVNINIEEPNAASIDLGDQAKRLAVQVTASTNVGKKISATCDSFTNNNLQSKYDRLIILFAAESKPESKIRNPPILPGVSVEIVGHAGIYAQIQRASPEIVQDILEILESEMAGATPDNLSKEQNTFLHLVRLLSTDAIAQTASTYDDDPDPNKKIEKRFADEAAFLKSEFTTLYAEYGHPLKEILAMPEYSQVRIRRLSMHLMNVSDQALIRCSGDPRSALDELVKEFSAMLSSARVQFDQTAIRFFLVHQLTQCNVFPNERAV